MTQRPASATNTAQSGLAGRTDGSANRGLERAAWLDAPPLRSIIPGSPAVSQGSRFRQNLTVLRNHQVLEPPVHDVTSDMGGVVQLESHVRSAGPPEHTGLVSRHLAPDGAHHGIARSQGRRLRVEEGTVPVLPAESQAAVQRDETSAPSVETTRPLPPHHEAHPAETLQSVHTMEPDRNSPVVGESRTIPPLAIARSQLLESVEEAARAVVDKQPSGISTEELLPSTEAAPTVGLQPPVAGPLDPSPRAGDAPSHLPASGGRSDPLPPAPTRTPAPRLISRRRAESPTSHTTTTHTTQSTPPAPEPMASDRQRPQPHADAGGGAEEAIDRPIHPPQEPATIDRETAADLSLDEPPSKETSPATQPAWPSVDASPNDELLDSEPGSGSEVAEHSTGGHSEPGQPLGLGPPIGQAGQTSIVSRTVLRSAEAAAMPSTASAGSQRANAPVASGAHRTEPGDGELRHTDVTRTESGLDHHTDSDLAQVSRNETEVGREDTSLEQGAVLDATEAPSDAEGRQALPNAMSPDVEMPGLLTISKRHVHTSAPNVSSTTHVMRSAIGDTPLSRSRDTSGEPSVARSATAPAAPRAARPLSGVTSLVEGTTMVSRAPAAEPGSPPSARDTGSGTETLQGSAAVGGGSPRQPNRAQTTASGPALVAGPAPFNLTTEAPRLPLGTAGDQAPDSVWRFDNQQSLPDEVMRLETPGTDNTRVLDTSSFGALGSPAEPPNGSPISAASTPNIVVHRSTSDPVPAAAPSAPTETFQWGELSRNEEPETSGNESPTPSALGDEGTDYGEVADQVYDRIERRLRYELLTDLERRGQLTRWR